MPGKTVLDAAEQICRRCKGNSAALVVRSEFLCRDCFIRYIHTKIIKRLESFRVRNASPNQPRKLLLPLSFGSSSVTLLHVLDHHLKTQVAKTGRAGYALHVLSVNDSLSGTSFVESYLKTAREQYPTHQYASLALHDIFSLIQDHSSLLDLVPGPERDDNLPAVERLAQLMNLLTSATARADVTAILRNRLILEYAASLGCKDIVWGDSTTRLAEKTLAQTAKGRGFSLPWQVTDRKSPSGVNFNYPLRDVLKKELVSYIDLANGTLPSLVVSSSAAGQPSMSSKNTTIDDLMHQYFESVEENFPSIVSNVVRTTGKLEITSEGASAPQCSFCSMPVQAGRFGIHDWGGDQYDHDLSTQRASHHLCYGCTRSIQKPTKSASGGA